MLGEPKKQFSRTRATLCAYGRAKSNSLSSTPRSRPRMAWTAQKSFVRDGTGCAPSNWTCRAVCRVNDSNVGQWSKPVSLTIGG